MQFHHHTLLQLADWLNEHYRGEKIGDIFSQNRNELIIQTGEEKVLRIGCHTPLTYLVPVSGFSRARKNVVTLFPQLLGLRFESFRVVPYDRVLIAQLEEGWELIAKMHSISANVLLRKDGQIQALFNHQLEDDWEYGEAPGPYDPAAREQTVAPEFSAIRQALREISPIYDKHFAQRCQHWMKDGLSFAEALERCEAEAMNGRCYLWLDRNRIRFTLLPPETEQTSVQIEDLVVGLRLFLRVYFQFEAYREQYKEAEQALAKPLAKQQRLLASYRDNVANLEEMRDPEELGHILMAHLHLVSPGDKKILLPDLYQGGKVEIGLDPKLSPQDNAARYYQKQKSRKLQLAHLKDQVAELEAELAEKEQEVAAFEALPAPEALQLSEQGWAGEAFGEMKAFWKEFKRTQEDQNQKQLPFRTFRREGYEIFVGKNARNNDVLSFKFANKQDLWLHAKDVTGSHVIIRQQAGKDLPPGVLEYAAQLAAFYSKRKQDSLVPVIYTPRKYIRKRKGDPPGLVAVDREQVIMVEPIRE